MTFTYDYTKPVLQAPTQKLLTDLLSVTERAVYGALDGSRSPIQPTQTRPRLNFIQKIIHWLRIGHS